MRALAIAAEQIGQRQRVFVACAAFRIALRLMAEATEILMSAITVLLAELRDEQPPAERWDPVKKGQSEIGRFEDRS